MTCPECGAILPGDKTCQNRFHALLAVEWGNPELARMHGLTVLTYHLQHPSLTKPWYQEAGYAVTRRIFGQGQDWLQVLMEGRQHHNSGRFKEWKKSYGTVLSPEILTRPVPSEMTVAAIDPDASEGQADQILAWARSVSMGRVLKENTAT